MTAVILSDYIVQKCINDKKYITNMRLQNILYYVQIEYLQNRKHPIFADDFSSWKFGPVIPSVYYRYSGFGVEPIDISFDKDTETISSEDKMIVDAITEKVRSVKLWDITRDILTEKGAWAKCYEIINTIDFGDNIIPKELIKAEKSTLLKEDILL